jgi:hypothetical protein
MTRIKTVTTVLTQDEILLRWARKAPSKRKHYARRGTVYIGGTLKMVSFAAFFYLVLMIMLWE